MDLKKDAQLKKDKVKWKAKNMRFAWQAYLYNIADAPAYDVMRDFYFVVTDGLNGVLVLKVGFAELSIAKAEIQKTLKEFRRCIMEECWDESYEFWKDKHVYELDNM